MVGIANYELGFYPGRSTSGAILSMRQLQEKYIQKEKGSTNTLQWIRGYLTKY